MRGARRGRIPSGDRFRSCSYQPPAAAHFETSAGSWKGSQMIERIVKIRAFRTAPSALLAERGRDPGKTGAQLRQRRPAEADAHVGIGHLEPVTLADVRTVVLKQRAIEPAGIEMSGNLETREAHHTAGRLDPFDARFLRQPAAHDAEPLAGAGGIGLEPRVALPQGRERDCLIDHRAADSDLLLRRQESLLQGRIARDEPADAYARDPIGLGYRGDADESCADAGARRIGG